VRYQITAACALSTIGCAPDSPVAGAWAGTVSDGAGSGALISSGALLTPRFRDAAVEGGRSLYIA
jgi:hypothetical protein